MKKLAKIMIIGLLAMSLTACGGSKKTSLEKQAAKLEESIKKDGLTEENMQKLMELADAVAENESSQTTVTPPASAPPAPAEEQKNPEELETPNDQMAPVVADDRMEMLEVFDTTEGIFFLEQDDHLYTLNVEKSQNPNIRYNIGYPYGNGTIALYQTIFSPEGNAEGVMSFGGVPVLTCNPGDKLIAYSQQTMPELELRQVWFSGYTVCAITNTIGNTIVCRPENQEVFSNGRQFSFQVKDFSGNTVEQYRNLKEDYPYYVCWTEGTQLREIELPATAKVYSFTHDYSATNPDYTIQGVPTADGYAIYDLSLLPPGLYCISRGCVIEIP